MTSWEVADVQWSPHASKPYWVISTSNQKALVWNLALPSDSAIEHMLHGHQRAITDINFHSLHPEILATCSIDSYIHVWDLRDPKQPAHSFADWRAGATQVKWNRRNENLLASSHDNKVYIWDKRKGTIPLHTLRAHSGKVNGLDFSRTEETKILSCSTDQTVLLWDYAKDDKEAEKKIHTNFPVWRARHTPFGQGCAIMPLRGGSNSVYVCDLQDTGDVCDLNPVHEFRGHLEPVKEFVWRSRGGLNGIEDREFQLVTWSKDHDLRLWPLSQETLKSVHYNYGSSLKQNLTRKGSPYITYQTEPEGSELQAQIKHPRKPSVSYGTSPKNKTKESSKSTAVMTGNTTQSVKPDNSHLHWISGVRIGRSAFAAPFDNNISTGDVPEDGEATPGNLGEEVSIVAHKFPRVHFENISVSTGDCVVSLNGPWGEQTAISPEQQLIEEEENKLIFLRLAIKFPLTYPFEAPSFLIKDSDKISETTNHEIIAELNSISQTLTSKGKYCLEHCLRYLLGDKVSLSDIDDDDDELKEGVMLSSLFDDGVDELVDLSNEFENSSSSGDDDQLEDSMVSKNNNVLAYGTTPVPKGCGAVWSKGGQLVCFFTQRKDDKKNFASNEGGTPNVSTVKSLNKFQIDDDDSSDSLESDSDEMNSFVYGNSVWPLSNNKFRNHFKIPQLGSRTSRGGGAPTSNTERSQGIYPAREKNLVKVYDFTNLIPSRHDLASEYKVLGGSPSELAAHNMVVAQKHNCYDVADCWKIISIILSDVRGSSSSHIAFKSRELNEFGAFGQFEWGIHPFGTNWLIDTMFAYFERQNNTQMLANMSCILSGRTNEFGTGPRPPAMSSAPCSDIVRGTPSPFIPREDSSRDFSNGYFGSYQMAYSSNNSSTPWDIPGGKQVANSGDQNIDTSPISSSKDDSSIMSLSPEKFMNARKAVAGIFSRNGGGSNTGAQGQFQKALSNNRFQKQSNDYDYNTNFLFNSGPGTRLTSRNSFYGSDTALTSNNVLPKVKVEMINENILDIPKSKNNNQNDQGYSYGSFLLNSRYEEKYMLYRAEYASVLYSWGLHIESLEVLKFNYSIYGGSVRSPTSPDIYSAQINFNPINTGSDGFEMMHGTSNLLNNRTLSHMCQFCSLIVRTRFFQCHNCEHIMHSICAEEWWGDALNTECPSGCGCKCVDAL